MLRDITTTSTRLNSAIIPCIRHKKKSRTVQFTEEGILPLPLYTLLMLMKSNGGGKETEETFQGGVSNAKEEKGAGATYCREFVYLE
jgi:hypothetical protein